MSVVDDKIKRLLDNGDKEKAFRLIVSNTSRRLYIVIRQILGDHLLSDDVLQDVYLKVFENIGGFEWKSSLYTWMHTIARRRAIEVRKKERTQATGRELDFMNAAASGFAGYDQWMKVFQLAVDSLPSRQKQVFLLRYYEEMPYNQMSGHLNLSEGGLKTSYHLAVQKIKTAINKQGLL